MGSLQGHDIVVVGGSRSVGRAIVETVWSEGATVLAVARGAADRNSSPASGPA
jgi:NAD(P)-dependent dehydrogenase (short-subunit alcohol dehydrogenase family)